MQVGRKIVEAVANRLAPTGGTESHRPDLFLADHQAVTTSTQRVLLAWGENFEVPTIEAIENYILGHFNGQVGIEHHTLRFFPKETACSFVVAWTSPTRRMKDADQMARVAPNTYLEGETKAIWEVRKGEDGTPHLVRQVKEDLGELLEERKKKAKHGKRAASFYSLREAQGYLAVGEGDEVSFYYRSQSKLGRVQGFVGDKVVIKSGAETYKLPIAAVSEVVTKDPKTVGDYKSRAKSYFTKVFGPEYTKKWLKKGEADSENHTKGDRREAALPKWKGADQVYSRLYALLDKMGADAWKAEVARAKKARRKPNPNSVVSDDMKATTDALNKGDEEQLKGLVHKYQAYKGRSGAAVREAASLKVSISDHKSGEELWRGKIPQALWSKYQKAAEGPEGLVDGDFFAKVGVRNKGSVWAERLGAANPQ